MKVILLRHGQTDWNFQEKIQGRTTDNPLNKTGRLQAATAAEELSLYPIDLIITSPLTRARQTANIVRTSLELINGEKSPPLIIDERITERNFGKYEGCSYKDAVLNNLRTWEDNEYGGEYIPGGEQNSEMFKRAFDFFTELKKLENAKESKTDKKGKEFKEEPFSLFLGKKIQTVLLVTHGAFSRAVYWYFKGFPKEGTPEYRSENCKCIFYDL